MDSAQPFTTNPSGEAAGRAEDLFHEFPTGWAIALALLMALLAVGTVLGNALVMLAFVVDTNLRTQNNYFLLNLAISDFLVGAFCIPLYMPYVLTGRWTFGKNLCKLWLVVDYLLCTSSVFNIVLISYDRFLSVTRAVTYRIQQNKTRHAVVKMVMVWALAFLLYGPAIIAWEYIAGRSIIPNEECYVEFYYNWFFLILASIVEFFSPFVSVTFFNLSIYLSIRKRTRRRLNPPQEVRPKPLKARKKMRSWKSEQKQLEKAPALHKYQHRASGAAVGFTTQEGTSEGGYSLAKESAALKRSNNALEFTPVSEKRMKLASHNIAQRFRLSRDKRVAKSLAVLVCVFALCWAPYTLLMIIRAMCHGNCVPHYWYEMSFWLLWVNSAINPVLYPLCHNSFKKAFIKILCPKKLKIQPH
uniref:Histamine H3 receptor n=1 Tax=Latimeria chalumnae TaxID=7897 RepID=H3ADH3_LATCH